MSETVELRANGAVAAVSLFGGHVLRYVPRDEPPVLWLSQTAVFDDKTPIRGGIPIIWPWFGSHPSDSSKPSHGFARRSLWQLDARETTANYDQVTLSLTSSADTEAIWPHSFGLRLTVQLAEALTVSLTTENRGGTSFRYGEALHSYFAVAAIGETVVSGLDGITYIDQLDDNQRKVQQGEICFAAETDNIYLNTDQPIIINDGGNQRQIIIETTGCRSAIVWNPWIEKAKRMADFEDAGYQQMVCVESGNVADNVVTLGPGEARTITAVMRVKR